MRRICPASEAFANPQLRFADDTSVLARRRARDNLPSDLGLEPYAVFHFLASSRPLRALFLREIDEGTGVDFQSFQLLKNLTAYQRNKAIPYLCRIVKLTVPVVTYDAKELAQQIAALSIG